VATHVARALAIAAYRPGEAAVGDAALACIAGHDGRAARAVLASMHGPDGAALASRVRRELAAPRPAHWRSVHPTWIDERLAGEGAAVRAAVTGDGDAPHERHLARAFLGGLWPMPDPTAPPARGVAALVALDPDVLARTIVLVGRRQVAHALTGMPRHDLAALAMRLTWGKQLIADVTALPSLGPLAERRLGRQSSAAARMRDVRVNEAMGPARVGLRALAPAVARVPQLAEQIAQRVSRPVGLLARIDLAFVEPADGVDDVELAQAIARASVEPT